MSHSSLVDTTPSSPSQASHPGAPGGSPTPSTRTSRVLVLIDGAVPNYAILADSLVPGVGRIVLRGDCDGIAQVTVALQHHFPIHSLHLICKGSPGCLTLGNTRLDLSSLDRYAWSLQDWILTSNQTSPCKTRNPFSLQPAAANRPHITLYGSCIAAGEAGQRFVKLLSQLTGTAIAASTRPMGHTSQGGCWELDYQTEAIAPEPVFQLEALQQYTELL